MLLILSLGGNSLVIAVVYRNRKLRTVINFFIVNMAVSDLLVPLSAHTRRIKRIYLPLGLWPVAGALGSTTCKIVAFSLELSIAVSVFTLGLIAIERFFCIIFPMKRQPIRSKKVCFIAIAVIWFISALYPSSKFYSMQLTHKGGNPYCIYSWEPVFDNGKAIRIDYSIFLITFTILPFLLLTSLYATIIVSLHRQKTHLHLAPEERRRRSKSNRRITYMLVTVVVVFLLTWTPLNIYGFLSAFIWRSHRPCEGRHLIFSAKFLADSYPAINPIIYYYFNAAYRQGFQEILFSPVRWLPCCGRFYTRVALDGESGSSVVGSRLSQPATLVSIRSYNKNNH